MDERIIISKIEDYVATLFSKDATGHDYYHMKRVATVARKIAIEENADIFISEAAGWLHDVGDRKLFDDPNAAKQDMINKLTSWGVGQEVIAQILLAIDDVSFSKGHVKPVTLEGKLVQDADRLDAIGAIGVARTFAYGGFNNRLIHTEEKQEQATATIQHFYDKLLLLKDLMNTDSAKRLAEERHRFMLEFLQQFYKEWDC
ncbi:HD domain-containing protein [Radiobacillus sp. PE A8.2]|uniref:HD domain-containing protein n=1 Tax=Radiobacillus sp. PE A8.2 TaxID=3380349 RepID=UPI00388D758C